jgi:hypothetical protein
MPVEEPHKKRRRGHGTRSEFEGVVGLGSKLCKQLCDVKMNATRAPKANDKLSMRGLVLGVCERVVKMCCELLPYAAAAEEDEETLELCRCHLQGEVTEAMKVERRQLKQEWNATLILEMEPVDMLQVLSPFLEGSHGALKEVAELKAKADGCVGPEQRAVIMRACAALCNFLSCVLLLTVEPAEVYDLDWVMEALSCTSTPTTTTTTNGMSSCEVEEEKRKSHNVGGTEEKRVQDDKLCEPHAKEQKKGQA